MKQLELLAVQARAALAAIGISCGQVRCYIVNTRAKQRLGLCRTVAPGVFDIEIAAWLLQDDAPLVPAMETILHELLHTVPTCAHCGHRGAWHALAARVHAAYPQYSVRATVKPEDVSAPPICFPYRVRCLRCGKTLYRLRRCPLTEHTERYVCTCGGHLHADYAPQGFSEELL